jgi:hypothetical protein
LAAFEADDDMAFVQLLREAMNRHHSASLREKLS